jgi:hypothetical protein
LIISGTPALVLGNATSAGEARHPVTVGCMALTNLVNAQQGAQTERQMFGRRITHASDIAANES